MDDFSLKKEEVKKGAVIWWKTTGGSGHAYGNKDCPAIITTVSKDLELTFMVKSFDNERSYEIRFKTLSEEKYYQNDMRIIFQGEFSTYFRRLQEEDLERERKEMMKGVERREDIVKNMVRAKKLIEKLKSDTII